MLPGQDRGKREEIDKMKEVGVVELAVVRAQERLCNIPASNGRYIGIG